MKKEIFFYPLLPKASVLLLTMLLIFPYDVFGQKRELRRLKRGLIEKYSYETNCRIEFDRTRKYLGNETWEETVIMTLFPGVLNRLSTNCAFRRTIIQREDSNSVQYVLYSIDSIQFLNFSTGSFDADKSSVFIPYIMSYSAENPFCQPRRFFAGISKGIIQYPLKTHSDTLMIKYVDMDKSFIREREFLVRLSDTTLIEYTYKASFRNKGVLIETNVYHYYVPIKELPDINFDTMAERIIQKHQELIEEEKNHEEQIQVMHLDQLHEDLTEEVYPEEGDSTASATMVIPYAVIDFSQYSMINLQGDTFALEPSDSAYTLLYFWYFGCPPCHRAIPAVNAIQKEYPHVRVIGVNHVNQRFSELAEYCQRAGMEFDIAYMPRFAREHPGGAPRFYVLDPDLRSIHMTRGYSPTLIREVHAVLDALPTGQ